MSGQFGLAQVLIHRFLADAGVSGEDGFGDAIGGPLDRLGRPFRREGLFPPFVDAALLGQGDAFPLPLPNQGAFDSAKAPMTESIRLAMGESSPVKTRLSLTNSTRTPLWVRV
ncbi:hypothetical protein QFZ33_002205 [Arthrobacter globiformis]|nr:hypothetical protein [Arthrobacter globiformis]